MHGGKMVKELMDLGFLSEEDKRLYILKDNDIRTWVKDGAYFLESKLSATATSTENHGESERDRYSHNIRNKT